MNDWLPQLPPGYSRVAPGHIASVVTCLEMTARPRGGGEGASTPAGGSDRRSGAGNRSGDSAAAPLDVSLDRFSGSLAEYRALFRRVGENWLWFSRLIMPDAELESILRNPAVEPLVLSRGGERVGLLELDFRKDGECELGFFGLVESEIGKGLGRYLMSEATRRAWAQPIRRLWVHTCSLDHPSALGFYIRSGFRVYARAIEVAEDPRVLGHLPRTAAPHVPIVE